MKLLISYRRADSAGTTGRIFDRLVARYGRQSVFIDVDDIPLGKDFRSHIREFMESADMVLLVIGPQWMGTRDSLPARLQEPDDPVRVEAELALQRGVHVIPVLVDGAVMPAASALPETLTGVSYLNAQRVDAGGDFHHHTDRLIQRIDELTGESPHAARIVPAAGANAVWGAVMAAVAAMPLALWLARLAPPWPPGLVVMTTLVVVASLLVVLQLLKEVAAPSLRRATFTASLVLLIVACVYPIAISLLTYETPTTKERWVKGFTCTSEAQALFADKCPFLGVDELRAAEYEAERLWTGSSVAAAKGGLLALWLAGFVAIAALAAALLVRYSRASA